MPKNTRNKKTPIRAKAPHNPLSKFMLIFVFLLSFVILMPTYLVLLVGMLPTTALLFTKGKYKYHKIYCVGGLNLTGVVPYIFELYSSSNNITQALSIISTPSSLIIMFGMSVIGYIIYWFLPKTFIMFYKLSASSRISSIQRKQTKIIDVWGNEVTRM